MVSTCLDRLDVKYDSRIGALFCYHFSKDDLTTPLIVINVPYYVNVVPILNSLDFVGKVIKLDVIFN